MEEMTLFQQIQAHRQGTALTAVLLEGEGAGEKLLLSGGDVLHGPKEGALLACRGELAGVRETGLVKTAAGEVFCDCISSEKELVICGGGHVSLPVIRLGEMLGFRVTVLEDRPAFADNARRAGAKQVICDSFENGLARVEGGADTYFVVVTRGHRYDERCLEQILEKPAAYVGMMGSRARAAVVRKNLLEAGFPKERVEGIFTPIGLDIHGETPEEIAVSILGEIIREKNGRRRSFGYPPEILEALLEAEKTEEGCVLATVIARRGSAPREVGTKMLFFPDGRTVGTIGGGCMEAAVRQEAGKLFRGKENPLVCPVNMAADEAEEEGMACGGNIRVLLERVCRTTKARR